MDFFFYLFNAANILSICYVQNILQGAVLGIWKINRWDKKHTPCYSGAYEYQWEQSIPVCITNRQKITASLVRKVFIGSTKGSNDGNILPLSAPNFWLTSSLSGKPKHSPWVPTLVSPGSLSLEVFRVLVVINFLQFHRVGVVEWNFSFFSSCQIWLSGSG